MNARFVGHGDLHDRRFDYLGSETAVFETFAGGTVSNVTDVPACKHFVRAYPSQIYLDQFLSRNPLYYALSLASVFVFTSLVFLLYDFCVERRQKIVLRSALQTGAIVSDLFPVQVREQLYREREQQDKKEDWTGENEHASPIATLYPDCTVLFADLVGFTKWSSQKTPTQVFDLLETLYGAFDKDAKRRKVFKVRRIVCAKNGALTLATPVLFYRLRLLGE